MLFDKSNERSKKAGLGVLDQVEVPHTDLAEVTRMVPDGRLGAQATAVGIVG